MVAIVAALGSPYKVQRKEVSRMGMRPPFGPGVICELCSWLRACRMCVNHLQRVPRVGRTIREVTRACGH